VTQHLLRTLFERKFFFDELYDVVFARPTQLIARRLRDDVETPVVHGSIDELVRATQTAAAGVGRAQTGLLRTYALVITGSVVALSIVFLVVR